MEAENACAICYTEFDNENEKEYGFTHCFDKHSFCASCIFDILQSKKPCPIDMTKIVSITIKSAMNREISKETFLKHNLLLLGVPDFLEKCKNFISLSNKVIDLRQQLLDEIMTACEDSTCTVEDIHQISHKFKKEMEQCAIYLRFDTKYWDFFDLFGQHIGANIEFNKPVSLNDMMDIHILLMKVALVERTVSLLKLSLISEDEFKGNEFITLFPNIETDQFVKCLNCCTVYNDNEMMQFTECQHKMCVVCIGESKCAKIICPIDHGNSVVTAPMGYNTPSLEELNKMQNEQRTTNAKLSQAVHKKCRTNLLEPSDFSTFTSYGSTLRIEMESVKKYNNRVVIDYSSIERETVYTQLYSLKCVTFNDSLCRLLSYLGNTLNNMNENNMSSKKMKVSWLIRAITECYEMKNKVTNLNFKI